MWVWLSLITLLLLFSAQTFAQPQRIITLSPHLTEMVFSAGAGKNLVGVAEYSDYPEAANKIPRIGGYEQINYEKILSLKPDLILVWKKGNRYQDIQRLKQLGFELLEFDSQTIESIPHDIEKIGEIMGTQKESKKISQRLSAQITQLNSQYQTTTPMTVFYQVWSKPIITIGGKQFISEALQLCGAKNIFDDQKALSPSVSLEAIIARNPQLILLGGEKQIQQGWKAFWQKYPQITAVQQNKIILLNSDLFQRPTARLINALPQLCAKIHSAPQ